ncbi:6-carboxytetrahydropterin synthase [Myxococcota bacterium]|nr:6-carboxytetrahydropterin synthase [Myxococcota bacterium]MCZ7620115.1 6-carboxytetrahydropterin synthase [Myxococcota bacterium]
MNDDRRVRLTRAIDFSASLRYRSPDLSEQENLTRFGPAARQHGHNYRLEVTVEGIPDPATGMVIDLKDLKRVLESEIMARFDHRDLNRDTPWFEKCPPTPEQFARVIWGLLRGALGDLLHSVRLRQDEDLWVEVGGHEEDKS